MIRMTGLWEKSASVFHWMIAETKNKRWIPQCYNDKLLTNVHWIQLFFALSPLDLITISYKDSRWVGAWWLGFIVTGTVVLLSGIPFFFLPKSLPKQGQEQNRSKSTELSTVAEQENFLPEEIHEEKEKAVTFQEMARGITQLLRL